MDVGVVTLGMWLSLSLEAVKNSFDQLSFSLFSPCAIIINDRICLSHFVSYQSVAFVWGRWSGKNEKTAEG